MRFSIAFLVILNATFAFGQAPARQAPQSPAANQKPVFEEYPLDLSKIGVNLPITTDPELRRVLTSPKTVFYKLPQIWQHYIPSSKIEYNNLTLGTTSYVTTDPVWGVFFKEHLPDFHANGNFPWETTVGLNSSHKEGMTIYRTINLLNLPEDKQGQTIPILVLSGYPVKWIYPPGTTVGEIIYTVHENKRYVQEIRTRKKSADCVDWQPGLYRPVASREEFMRLTGLNDYAVAYKHFYFRNPQEDEVFKMEGLVERLPPLDVEKVKELLARPFKGIPTDSTTWSPASDQDFHLLPKNYCFSLLGSVDSHTCASCHRQTQISVRNLTPKDPDVIRYPKKVGNIRGDDAVFTWHPFSLDSARHNDTDPAPKIAVRPYDTKNGVIKILAHDEKHIGVTEYKLTKFVQDSLKPYELPAEQFLHHKER